MRILNEISLYFWLLTDRKIIFTRNLHFIFFLFLCKSFITQKLRLSQSIIRRTEILKDSINKFGLFSNILEKIL